MLLLCGLGGASSRYPCFICRWDRNNPEVPGAMRCTEDSNDFANWAEELLRPLLEAGDAVSKANELVKNQTKLVGQKEQEGVHAVSESNANCELDKTLLKTMEADLTEAKNLRVKAVKIAQAKVIQHPKLVSLWEDPSWLQAQWFNVVNMPLTHLEDRSDDADTAPVYRDLCEAWKTRNLRRKELKLIEKELAEMKDQVNCLSTEWEEAFEASAWADSAWQALVNHVNQDLNLYVHANVGRDPRLGRPKLKASAMTLTLLKQLLGEACQGMQRTSSNVRFLMRIDGWNHCIYA
jgi:hypothetical protein